MSDQEKKNNDPLSQLLSVARNQTFNTKLDQTAVAAVPVSTATSQSTPDGDTEVPWRRRRKHLKVIDVFGAAAFSHVFILQVKSEERKEGDEEEEDESRPPMDLFRAIFASSSDEKSSSSSDGDSEEEEDAKEKERKVDPQPLNLFGIPSSVPSVSSSSAACSQPAGKKFPDSCLSE